MGHRARALRRRMKRVPHGWANQSGIALVLALWVTVLLTVLDADGNE